MRQIERKEKENLPKQPPKIAQFSIFVVILS